MKKYRDKLTKKICYAKYQIDEIHGVLADVFYIKKSGDYVGKTMKFSKFINLYQEVR